MVDSSPQGSHDWLNSTITSLAVSQVKSAWRLFLQIWRDVQIHQMLGEELNEKHTEAVEQLDALLIRHRGTPTCLASGRSSLYHKVHAYYHSIRLETVSWEVAALVCRSTVSYTTDFGTESSISSFPEVSVADMFPWMLVDSIQIEGAPAEDTKQDRADAMFSHSALQVPGIMHVVHNVVRDFPVVMPSYAPFLAQLQAVSRLLSVPWSCQRLLHTCGKRLLEEELDVLRNFNCQAWSLACGPATGREVR